MNLLDNKVVGMRYCDCCDNYVPAVEFEGDLYCGYEFEAYPDIANIIG